MDDYAILTESLIDVEYKFRKIQLECKTLREGLNSKNIEVKRIMKWQIQILQYVSDANLTIPRCLYPINLDTVTIDIYGDIVKDSIFRTVEDDTKSSDLITINSLVNSGYTILQAVRNSNIDKRKRKQIDIFMILYKHLILNSQINYFKDMFKAINHVSLMLQSSVESGIIDELSKVT